jgi:(S)-2-hydroxyglutarate dehydrogenase
MKHVVIIGGGIVGLATAYQAKLKFPDLKITILEKEATLAAHQTGHNSGVIHSGIYYKPGSLKATNCLRGYRMLLDFCRNHQIPYELCGKIIVATKQNELEALDALYQKGIENGLEGLKYLDSKEIKYYEPAATGIKGLFVPQTGIVAYRQLTKVLGEVFLNMKHTAIKTQAEVVDFKRIKDAIEVVLKNGESIHAHTIVNCAGLYCDKVAKMAGEPLNIKIIPFRGEYYTIKPEKAHLVKSLIYPVPDSNFPFLGVHFTRRITGEIEAGPNAVFAFRREGYSKTSFHLGEFLESICWRGFQKVAFKYWKTGIGEYYRSYSKQAFTKALQKLLPDIQSDDLIPAASGVRAQAVDSQGNLLDDFYIQQGNGFIHVLNAPSPAATSSLSIGLTIAEKLTGC